MKKAICALLVVGVILVLVAPAYAGDIEILHEFVGGSTDGRTPTGSLTLDSGRLYGTTERGGGSGGGTVFALVPEPATLLLLAAGGLAMLRRR